MKKYIYKSILALAVIISAASCETLDYNEQYFSDLGYESDPEITNVQTLDITLTADDYATLAALYDNTYMASSAGLSAELAAVGTNGYFTDLISGDDYIPAYLESVYDSYLSVGSKVKVTYSTSVDEPEELAKIMAGSAYTVSEEDYAAVWGEEVEASYFTPAVSAESNLPSILAAALPEAEAGDYALVSYAYSATEPSVASGDDSEEEEEVLVQGFGDFMIDINTVTITETDGTFVVNGIPFDYVGLSQDSSYGTIYIESTVSGYIKNTSAITGLEEIIVEGNGYVKTNLVVYAGATADSLVEVVSVSDAGSGWGSFYSYPMPEGTQFVMFGIPDGATYDASVSGIEFNVTEDFSIDSTVTITETDGTFAVNCVSFDYVGLSQDSSYGTVYIESTVSGYIKNTTAMPGLQEIIVEGNGYVKTNLLVSVGATADSLTELVSVSDAGSGWGSFYSYIVPEGTEFVMFGIPDGATYDASFSGIDFVFSDESSASPAKVSTMAKAAAVVTSTLNDVYQFDGSAWSLASSTTMLDAADYTAMGSTYGNLSGTQPETYLPIYLANNYPYALDGDYVDVVYKYYSSSTYTKASRFNKEGNDWVMEDNIEVVAASPFEKNDSGWAFNPSTTISIGTTDSENVALYFPTMLSYVKSNYGSEYIDSYGTSEYYSGSASYYGNINWRYSYVLGYWATAGIDCSPYYTHTNGSDGLVAMYDVLKANLAETLAYALSVHNSDANAVDGLDVLYTVQFGLYYGPTISGVNAEMIFQVVGPGKFEYVEMNFLDSSADVYSEDNLAYVISTYGSYYQ